MNGIPAQEIKRRGIAAVDDGIDDGDLHVIRNNKPQYVRGCGQNVADQD